MLRRRAQSPKVGTCLGPNPLAIARQRHLGDPRRGVVPSNRRGPVTRCLSSRRWGDERAHADPVRSILCSKKRSLRRTPDGPSVSTWRAKERSQSAHSRLNMPKDSYSITRRGYWRRNYLNHHHTPRIDYIELSIGNYYSAEHEADATGHREVTEELCSPA
jgi:hypothetical protein